METYWTKSGRKLSVFLVVFQQARGRILRRPLQHLERCSLLVQALGKGFFSSFGCCCSVLIPTWELTGTPTGHQCHPLPGKNWRHHKRERLINTCPLQVTDLGTKKLPPEAGRAARDCHWSGVWGEMNSEVIPCKVQHSGFAGWKGEVPNRALGFAIVPEQALCDIIVKGRV